MFKMPEQFAAANKANTEALLNLANTAFAGMERLAALNLNAARALMEDNVASLKSLAGVKDVQTLMALNADQAKPGLDKAVAYSRDVYEIFTGIQGEVAKIIEAQVADAQSAVTGAIENASKNAPKGTEGVFTAVKSAIAASNSAYDNATKMVRQVSDIAEANLSAATGATVKAAGASAAKLKKVA
ncbi:MAG: phasin family protein [Rhodocyclaceae bacterium]|nr:MAG: phasin family protein [Rhodocyclaceae bacterium]